MRRIFVGI